MADGGGTKFASVLYDKEKQNRQQTFATARLDACNSSILTLSAIAAMTGHLGRNQY
jgi:hypothetical protein